MTLFIIANWMQGDALSGGDKIFIELSRRWSQRLPIVLCVSKDGWEICKREGLGDFKHNIWSLVRFQMFGYPLSFLYRTVKGLFHAARLRMQKGDIVYSSSDFWPDALPAFLLKLKDRRNTWIAGFYLFAPGPFQKDSPYKGRRWFVGLFYWLAQKPVYWIVRAFADMVFVTSEPDVEKFVTPKRQRDKIVVVQGGVDLKPSQAYLNSGGVIPFEERRYDACFIGRLHDQKGVLELLDVWQRVVGKRPQAQLIIIGSGPLEHDLLKKIKETGLGRNITLLGFRTGEDKFAIFKQSRLVLHPATFDSGGMAAAEAMAWGLPGVSFDLDALKTYYAQGMLKTKCFDLDEFASNILRLLNDKSLYETISAQALAFIRRQWDWDQRAEQIYRLVTGGNNHGLSAS